MPEYFVIIYATDPDSLRALQKFELDVFPQTSKRNSSREEYQYSIDGLLTIEQVEKIVRSGYRVEILDPAEKRMRAADNITEFPQWLEGMKKIMKRERPSRRPAKR
ncbi:MAG: hypothetical protein AB7P24_01145 [Nitrospira sp.]